MVHVPPKLTGRAGFVFEWTGPYLGRRAFDQLLQRPNYRILGYYYNQASSQLVANIWSWEMLHALRLLLTQSALYLKSIVPYIVGLVLTLACLAVHFSKDADSMLNDHDHTISNGYLQELVEYHRTLPAFAKRPLITALVDHVSSSFKLSVGEAFVTIEFLLLFASGLALYFLSLQLTGSSQMAVINMAVYFTCFSNLFAFFTPVYTYDEPLQYLLLFLAIIFLIKENWVLYVVTFSLGLIARESGLMLFPGLFIIFLLSQDEIGIRTASFRRKDLLRKAVLLSLPALIYAVYLYYYASTHVLLGEPSADMAERTSNFDVNLQDQKYAVESMISLFLVGGLPLYLLYNRISPWAREHKKYIFAFLITLLINSMIVIISTKDREVRLFTLPMIFLWPVFAKVFQTDLKHVFSLRAQRHLFSKWSYVAMFLFLNLINYIVSFKVYYTTIGLQTDNYFNEYLFVYTFIMIDHAMLKYLYDKGVLPNTPKSAIVQG
ncbi:MAG: hypothetical protein WBO28_05475 [Flavobacteriales bacterium]